MRASLLAVAKYIYCYFKGDPTSSGVKEPRENSPISFSLLHSLQTVIFAGFKI